MSPVYTIKNCHTVVLVSKSRCPFRLLIFLCRIFRPFLTIKDYQQPFGSQLRSSKKPLLPPFRKFTFHQSWVYSKETFTFYIHFPGSVFLTDSSTFYFLLTLWSNSHHYTFLKRHFSFCGGAKVSFCQSANLLMTAFMLI